MRIVWDEPKRLANTAKHGLDFADLTLAFFETAVVEESRQGRYLAISELNGILIVAVVFRPVGTEAVAIISMRRASRSERKRHDEKMA